MRLRQITALIACLAALVAAGCGSSDKKGKPIPAATRVELDKQLNSIKARFDFGGGACADIAQNKASVQRTLDSLPSDTDSDVKNALVDGFNKLFQNVDSQCDTSKGQQTETQTTESTPAPAPTPTETQPTPTETNQQTSTTPAPKPKPKPKPKPGDNGNGNGAGNGGGKSVPQSGAGGGTSPGDLP
jgi:cell division septation protein DedD